MRSLFMTCLALVLFLALAGCKTPQPALQVEEKPPLAQIEPEGQAPSEELSDRVSDQEISSARRAITRAEEAEADKHAADLLRKAYDNLKNALPLRDADPSQSRSLLKEAKKSSQEAYARSFAMIKKVSLAKMKKHRDHLLSIEADRFSPETFAKTVKREEKTIALFEKGVLSDALASYRETLSSMNSLKEILQKNLSWIHILKRDAENYLSDAEGLKAFIWAPEEVNKASSLLLSGMSAFREYNLIEAEQRLDEARFHAKNALYLTKHNKALADTDARLKKVQILIEESSQQNVVTDQGQEVKAKPWRGEEFLKEFPLNETGGASVPEYVPETLKIKELSLEKTGRETLVMGMEEEEVLLRQAQTLWQKGVLARNEGDFELANDYFERARIYAETYRNLAVMATYTVRYRKENRDCLWRIANFSEHYGNPFLWPKIWRRNRKAIHNPDLIYPGQVLIIPPL